MDLLSTAKWLAALATAGLLCACSKSIDTVKNSPAPDASYKLGQLLEHKDNCVNTKWSTDTDDKGRKTVEFRCEVKPRSEVIDAAAQEGMRMANNDIDSRLREGPRLTVWSGIDDRMAPLTLDGIGIPNRLTFLRQTQDPSIDAKLDELKQRYDIVVQQLEQADAPCVAQLRQRRVDNIAHARQYLADHSVSTEVMRWTLNDGEIVSIAADLTNAEGASVLHGMSPSVLYTYALSPTDRMSEEKLIVALVSLPAQEEADLNLCGHAEAYQPATEALIRLQHDVVSVQQGTQPTPAG